MERNTSTWDNFQHSARLSTDTTPEIYPASSAIHNAHFRFCNCGLREYGRLVLSNSEVKRNAYCHLVIVSLQRFLIPNMTYVKPMTGQFRNSRLI